LARGAEPQAVGVGLLERWRGRAPRLVLVLVPGVRVVFVGREQGGGRVLSQVARGDGPEDVLAEGEAILVQPAAEVHAHEWVVGPVQGEDEMEVAVALPREDDVGNAGEEGVTVVTGRLASLLVGSFRGAA